MTPEERSILSEYRQLTSLNARHGVFLLQHTESGELYVQKTLVNYQADIFTQLKAKPVPNMPRIVEAIEDDGRLIVIESYVSGRTLQKILDQEGPLPVPKVLEIGQQLCAILKQLHARGIIHRDVKPSNVILSDDGVVKLLDLDAAKVYKAREKADTRLIGTHGFAAPEQYGFAASSPVTDIYAAGVLLNVLAAGDFPNAASTPDASLNAVISRCIRMEPAERYQSVEELEKALRRISSGKDRWKKMIPILCGALFLAVLFFVIRPFQDRTSPSGSGTVDSAGTETPSPSLPVATDQTKEASQTPEESSAEDLPAPIANARAEATGTNHLNPAEGELSAIIDTVDCRMLEPGKEYVIRGVLMNKESGAPITIKGKQLTEEVLFTPTDTVKAAELTFHFDASALAGSIVVVFESILEEGTEIFSQTDINDPDKTVYIPKLTTYAVAEDTKAKVTREGKMTTIIDTVTYEGLEAGREYTLYGWLYDQGRNGDLLTGGTKTDPVHKDTVSVETTFIPASSSGSLDLPFSFDSTLLSGKIIVVAEELLTDGKTVADHIVFDDWDQMVFIPKISSGLHDNATGSDQAAAGPVVISDTVYYSALTPGLHYHLQGKLLNKATLEPILVEGEEITAEESFAFVGSSEGTHHLAFVFDASAFVGVEFVAVEILTYEGIIVAAHDEITDEDPTVTILPEN